MVSSSLLYQKAVWRSGWTVKASWQELEAFFDFLSHAISHCRKMTYDLPTNIWILQGILQKLSLY